MGQSKKNRQSKNGKSNAVSQRRSYFRLAIVLGTVLILFGAAVLFLPTGEDGTPADFIPEVLGAPRVAVAQEQLDVGDVPVNQFVEAEFLVRNIGDEVLQVLNEPVVEVREGCCPPRAVISSTSIAPGGEASIMLRFTMHEGMDGPHDFRIHLNTNDPAEPIKELVVLSNWVS